VKVILGGNHFIDCPILLAYKGTPMLRVLFHPLRVELNLPPDLPAAPHPPVVRHVTTERSDAIFSAGDHAIAIATLLDPATDTAHLLLDLRPVGLNIYDDLAGLHIGDNLITRNEVQGAGIAINLA
jgi:hypothetical protein